MKIFVAKRYLVGACGCAMFALAMLFPVITLAQQGNSAEIYGDSSFGVYYGDASVETETTSSATTALDPRAVEAGGHVLTILILALIVLLIIAFLV